ncbi:Uncharacterised protein [Legionella hackeliae]|nr:hypothetical protein Lhac_0496 [Legionella hackeliae]STX47129.1 Uncharacterised protein [Legionella hackeliae]
MHSTWKVGNASWSAKEQVQKKTKYLINHQRIYPPLTKKPEDLFAMATPILQAAPEKYSG